MENITSIEMLMNMLAAILVVFPFLIDDMKEHMRTDTPVDVARDKAIARGVFYVVGLGVSGFIGWLFSHLGGR